MRLRPAFSSDDPPLGVMLAHLTLADDPSVMADEQPSSQLQRYEIRVRGQLGEMMRSAFPGLAAETDGEDTVLRGALRDQAALHGVLAQIEALGLDLLEVRRLPASVVPGPGGSAT